MIYLPELDYGNLIDWNHPETQGLISNYIVLPGHFGGTIWWDIIGTNHGTQTNMAPPSTSTSGRTLQTTRPGGVGEMRFDGSNNYIAATPCAVTTFPYTMMGWVKLASTSLTNTTDEVLFAITKPSGLEEAWVGYYRYDGNGGYQLRLVTQGSGVVQAKYFSLTFDTIWHHICVQFVDNTTKNLYLDGLNRTLTVSNGNTGTPTPSGLTTFNIGNFLYNTSTLYQGVSGSIDDVRLYNRVLSAGEISAIYASSSIGLPPYLRRLSTIFYSIPAAAATRLPGPLRLSQAVARAAYW